MARSRLPAKKAQTSGAALHDPGRFKGRAAPKDTKPIGLPYPGMTAAERKCWNEFVADLPWLHAGHRILLRMACRLAARLDGEDFGVSAARVLSSLLSKLGATPVDESKVAQRPGDKDDPGEGFFGRPN